MCMNPAAMYYACGMYLVSVLHVRSRRSNVSTCLFIDASCAFVCVVEVDAGILLCLAHGCRSICIYSIKCASAKNRDEKMRETEL